MVPRPGGRSGGGVAIRSLNVVVIYRPLSSAQYPKPFSAFISEFRTFLEEKVTMSGRLIILGDFNIHVDVSSNREAKLFLEMLDLLNFEALTSGGKKPKPVEDHQAEEATCSMRKTLTPTMTPMMTPPTVK